MARVFVDTSALFPFSIMDVMLALTENSVHEVVWTEALLAEWERVVVREQKRSVESAMKIVDNIREFFPEGKIAEQDYIHLIAAMPGDDPDDRRHMAAAVAGDVETIVTWNRRDFPSLGLAAHSIRVMDPDEYLCELIAEIPEEVVATVIRLAGQKRRPPMTPFDLVDRLESANAANFGARLRSRLEMLGLAKDTIAVRSNDGLEDTSGGIELDKLPRQSRPSDLTKPRMPRQRTTSAVLPAEVGTYLAARRPPPYSIAVKVGPHSAVGQNSHAYVLEAILREMLTSWPDGTTLVLDYPNRKYLQALAYPPHVLTEIGRVDEAQMATAVRFGWMDPATFTARHPDFASQPVWEINPVREWIDEVDSLEEVASFLHSSVQKILNCDLGKGYRFKIFNNHGDRLQGQKYQP